MKVAKYNITSKKWVYTNYPRYDMKPIVGLDKKFLFLIPLYPEKMPEYNPSTEELVEKETVLLDKPHPDYPEFKTLQITYTVVKRSVNSIMVDVNHLERDANESASGGDDKFITVLTVLSVLLKGFPLYDLTEEQRLACEQVLSAVEKINKNALNKQKIKEMVENGEAVDINSGLEM